MRSVLILVLGLAVAYPVQAREFSLRKECSRDRCVYYKGSKRIFSVEQEEGTGCALVRNSKREPVAHVSNEDGTVRIKTIGGKRQDLQRDLYEED